MPRPPELKRPNARHQNIQHQCRGLNVFRGNAEKRHHRNVTRCSPVSDRGVEERDAADRDREKECLLNFRGSPDSLEPDKGGIQGLHRTSSWLWAVVVSTIRGEKTLMARNR